MADSNRSPRSRTRSDARRRLRILAALPLAACALAAAAPARAAVLGSAVLLSTDAQQLDCFVSNVGRGPAAIASVSIVNGGSTILSLSGNTCVGTLAPGGNCVFSANLDTRFSARGVVEVAGSARGLRGQCQLTASNRIIATTELR